MGTAAPSASRLYTPTFGKSVLKLSLTDALIVTFCIALSNLFWLPTFGALSDRIGRRPILLGFTIVTILTAYPMTAWLVAHPSFERMLTVELWLSFLYGGYNGAMVVALTEVVPAHVRTVSFSLCYSLATALFGGFTPAIPTALIEITGDKAAPALWMTLAAFCGAAATLWIYGLRRETLTAAQTSP